jgi:hypothetical protein
MQRIPGETPGVISKDPGYDRLSQDLWADMAPNSNLKPGKIIGPVIMWAKTFYSKYPV